MWWSRWRKSPYYKPSLVSIGFHLLLLFLLSINWLWAPAPHSVNMVQSAQKQAEPEIIQAKAIIAQQDVKKVEQLAREELRKPEPKPEPAKERTTEIAEQKRVKKAEEEKRAQEAAVREEQAEAKRVAEEQKKVAEAKRKAEEQKKVEEAKRKAEEQKRAEEVKRKAEEQKKAEEAKRKAEEQKKAEEAKRKAEEQRKAQEEQLRQEQLLAEQQALNAERQSWVSSELSRHVSMITQKIGNGWIVPPGVDRNLTVRVLVRLAPDGAVLSAAVTQGSGNAALDQSALNAVWKASPLPVSSDPSVFSEMRELDIILSPQHLN